MAGRKRKHSTLKTQQKEETQAPCNDKLKVAASSEPKAAPVAVVDESAKKKKKKKNKKSKKTYQQVKEETTKGSKATQEAGAQEIDDLFGSLKQKKLQNKLSQQKEQQEKAKSLERAKKENEELHQKIKLLEAQNTNSTAQTGKNPDARPVRYDEDGLPIYTEEALRIGKGGNTADCPFDCWCCF